MLSRWFAVQYRIDSIDFDEQEVTKISKQTTSFDSHPIWDLPNEIPLDSISIDEEDHVEENSIAEINSIEMYYRFSLFHLND